MPFVAACPQLTHLHVRSPWLYGESFLAFFSSPNMQRLQSLVIEQFSASGDRAAEAADFSAAFCLMHSLCSLTLTSVDDIDKLLPHVRHAPALRRLTICTAACDPGCAATIPSARVLLRLMHACPLLHCAVVLPRLHPLQRHLPAPAMRLEGAALEELESQLDGRMELLDH
jgi:hypothetical protein